jgi:membrane fusion protein, multidrug efflux system
MTRKLMVAAMIAAGLAACEPEKMEPPPLQVSVAPAESKDVTEFQTWVGLLDGFQNAEVRAQVTGYLLSQDYKEGKLVKKGDILFTIDARPFEAALAQAQADYAEKVAQAQLAEITLERQTELFERKVISQQEFDTAAQNAQAAVALAAAAQASVQSAQVNLDYCTIKAPFEGIVGKAQAQTGDLVGPGGSETVLTQISQLDPIKAIFSITEREYLIAAPKLAELENRDIQPTTPGVIALTLANGQEFEHKGHFYFINRQVNVDTGTITIETLFPNPNNLLRPGLFARVTAPVKTLKDAVVVPLKAVVELQGSHLVSIVEKDNTIRTVMVALGPPDGDANISIQGDVKAGDQVVVEGVEKVRPGDKVTTKPYSPSASPSPTPAKAGASPAPKSDPKPKASPSPTATPQG